MIYCFILKRLNITVITKFNTKYITGTIQDLNRARYILFLINRLRKALIWLYSKQRQVRIIMI